MATHSVKDRLAALEAQVAELKLKVTVHHTSVPWWERISGTFANDPIHEEAMKLGRKYRESLRPRPKTKRKADAGSRH